MQSRHAIVTGGTAGIGLSLVRGLLKTNYQVLTCARRKPDWPEDLQDHVKGKQLQFFQADFEDLEQIQAFGEFALSVSETWSALVNNAGVVDFTDIRTMTLSTWQAFMNINLTAPLLLTQTVLPGMQQASFGRIVNISSISGKTGKTNRAAYATTKHGLIGLTRTIADEFGKAGITCNCICPGPTNTPALQKLARETPGYVEKIRQASPSGRILEPEEVASWIMHLIEDPTNCLNGQTIVVDGGFYQN